VTFTEPLGYLDKGHDFDGTLTAAEKAMDYFSTVGCVPILDKFLAKNPYFKVTLPGFDNIPNFTVQRMNARFRGTDGAVHDPSRPDFLDMFVEAQKTSLDTVSNDQIVAWLMINLIAGADTTAITIRSALYFSLRRPSVWRRLRADLAAAGVHSCPVPYRACRHVPYLEAVVREALRILPGVSLPLERYVPAGGFHLADGRFVPGGATVGINPYVVARDLSVWGADAEDFRPERWLRDEAGGETEAAFRQRLQRMNDADLSFGAGTRVCIGKHLGLVQVYKVVATIATLYDVELAEPEKEWTVKNSWFPRQKGLDVRISRRACL
jgi:cytochrome P450